MHGRNIGRVSTTITDAHLSQITFTFDREVNQKLYLYYKLDNYYQNHRLYVSSRNAAQLGGEVLIEMP